jgi:hypothetical protein
VLAAPKLRPCKARKIPKDSLFLINFLDVSFLNKIAKQGDASTGKEVPPHPFGNENGVSIVICLAGMFEDFSPN